MFTACLHPLSFMAPSGVERKVLELLKFYESTFPPLWRTLWEIRSPFLNSEYICRQSDDPSILVVHNGLTDCVGTIGMTIERYLYVSRIFGCYSKTLSNFSSFNSGAEAVPSPSNSYLPHIMVVIWVNNKTRAIRSNALNHLSKMCGPHQRHPSFYEELSSGSITAEVICGCIIRDLKDEHLVNQQLYATVFVTYFLFSDRRGWVIPEIYSSRPILYCLLAACRRQHCLGDPANNTHTLLFSIALNFFK